MTKDELLVILKRCKVTGKEEGHEDADHALLAYINDPEISEAWHDIGKWFA